MDHTDNKLTELYETQEARIDTILRKDNAVIWSRLVKMMMSECKTLSNDEIISYVQNNYGIKLHFSDNAIQAGWSPDCEIFDQELYTLFLLKYT
jgi:hypothetical protein